MAEVEHVDEILKRLASPPEQKQANTEFGFNTTSSSDVPIEPRSIVEIAHLSLNRFVDDSSPPLVIVGGGNVQQNPSIPIATGADADLTALVRIQEERIEHLTNLNEHAVRITENATASIRNEEKSVRAWVEAKVRTLEEQRQEWYARAEKLVEEKGSQMAAGRLAVEEEWNDLAQRLPHESRSRLIMQTNIPPTQRAELAGGSATQSMISRAKRHSSESDRVQNVHWKMRSSVDNLIDQRIAQAQKAAREATRSLSKGAVAAARTSIHDLHTKYRAADSEAERRVAVLEQALRSRNIPYQHLMAYCAERVRQQRAPLLTRLKALV